MKKFKTTTLLFAVLIGFMSLTGFSSKDSSSCASCNEGRAIGAAHSELASCLAGLHDDYNVNYYASPNEMGGYTVYVSGGIKCPQGQICPLFVILFGSVVLDADCNVVEVHCGFNN